MEADVCRGIKHHVDWSRAHRRATSGATAPANHPADPKTQTVRTLLRVQTAADVSRHHCAADQHFFGALGGTRTPNLLIRSQMLYPIELRTLGPGECRWNTAEVQARNAEAGRALEFRWSVAQGYVVEHASGERGEVVELGRLKVDDPTGHIRPAVVDDAGG